MLLVVVLFGYVNLLLAPTPSFFLLGLELLNIAAARFCGLRLASPKSSSSPLLSVPFTAKIFLIKSGLNSTLSIVTFVSFSSHSKNSSDLVNFTGGRRKLERNVILIKTSTPDNAVENEAENGALAISIVPKSSLPNVKSTRLMILFPKCRASRGSSRETNISPRFFADDFSATLNPILKSIKPLFALFSCINPNEAESYTGGLFSTVETLLLALPPPPPPPPPPPSVVALLLLLLFLLLLLDIVLFFSTSGSSDNKIPLECFGIGVCLKNSCRDIFVPLEEESFFFFPMTDARMKRERERESVCVCVCRSTLYDK